MLLQGPSSYGSSLLFGQFSLGLKTGSDPDFGKASWLFIVAITLGLLVIYPQFI